MRRRVRTTQSCHVKHISHKTQSCSDQKPNVRSATNKIVQNIDNLYAPAISTECATSTATGSATSNATSTDCRCATSTASESTSCLKETEKKTDKHIRREYTCRTKKRAKCNLIYHTTNGSKRSLHLKHTDQKPA